MRPPIARPILRPIRRPTILRPTILRPRLLPALAALALLASPAAARSPGDTPQTRLGPGVTLGGGSFSTGDGLTVALELRNVTGRVAVCGTWAASRVTSSYTVGAARDMVRRASVFLGNRRLVQNLSFMPKTAALLDYAGAPARCRVTAQPWGASGPRALPRLRIPAITLDTGRGSARSRHSGGIGPRITFRQDGPGAIDNALDVAGVFTRNAHHVSLSPRATRARGTYTTGGTVSVAAELRAVNGRAMLCGHWSVSGTAPTRTTTRTPLILTRDRSRAMLRHAQARDAQGHLLRQDLSQLIRVNDPAIARANCLPLQKPAGPGTTLRLHLPAIVVWRNTGPDGSRVIRLIPSGPPARDAGADS